MQDTTSKSKTPKKSTPVREWAYNNLKSDVLAGRFNPGERLTEEHLAELRNYAENLWKDAVKLEELWRAGRLNDVVHVGREERELAMSQPWRGSPVLMVSDGLFSFGADLMNEE